MPANDRTPAARLRRRGQCFWLCLAVNVGFLLLVCRLFYCRTINDDFILSLFVNGAYGKTDLHTPYEHFLYAALLRSLYALGPGTAWYTLVQYALLCVSNAVLCALILERQGLKAGIALSLLLLAGFGFPALFWVTYTMTAGVAAAAGMLLLLRTGEAFSQGERPGPLLLPGLGGLLLGLMAVLLRWNMALPCFALLAVLALPPLRRLGNRERLRFLTPLLLLLVLAVGLHGADRLFWRAEPYAAWEELNDSRTALMDYHPSGLYQIYSPEYAEAEVGQSEVEMLSLYINADPEVFTPALYDKMTAVMDEVEKRPSLPGCLLLYVRNLLRGIRQEPFYAAAALMLGLWLLGGRKAPMPGVVGLWLLLFSALYLALVYKGRYGVGRVDHALLLTGFLTVAMLPLPRGGKASKARAAALLLGLCFVALLCHPRAALRKNADAELAEATASLPETYAALNAEEGRVFLDAQAINYRFANDPLLSPAPGSFARVIPVSGWPMQHPLLRAALAEQGIENPFRDTVGRDEICWISDNIETIVRYIRLHYAPQASADLLEPLSTETGLKIYRIKEG